eukprot:946624-Pelagomonas_calceolata.AAC.2
MPHQPPHVPPISCPTNLLTCAACPTNPVHSAGAAFAAPPTSTLAALASMALVAVAPIELLVAPLLLLDTGGAAGERACLLCLTSPPVICRCFLRGGGCGGSDPGEGKESKGKGKVRTAVLEGLCWSKPGTASEAERMLERERRVVLEMG